MPGNQRCFASVIICYHTPILGNVVPLQIEEAFRFIEVSQRQVPSAPK